MTIERRPKIIRVQLTITITDDMRLAIAHHYGWNRRATPDECRHLMDGLLTADLQMIMADYEQMQAENEI